MQWASQTRRKKEKSLRYSLVSSFCTRSASNKSDKYTQNSAELAPVLYINSYKAHVQFSLYSIGGRYTAVTEDHG